ncbi:C40 family peptidase [bacterium]|nr:C40 family peptidase [bacterium]MBU1957482.1 C40 family peptidase [bacterium]
MNFVKNTLLLVIAIQVMVLVQLTVIKYGHQKDSFNAMFDVLTFNTVSASAPSVHRTGTSAPFDSMLTEELSPEEIALAMSINQSLQEKIKSFKSLLTVKKSVEYSCDDNHPLTQEVESYAKKFLGTRYVWGATGPNKFDCSGFTQKVYRSAGIKIPRVSCEQAKVGSYIKYENLKRGDMVFFDTKRKQTGKVNHVGIYLEDGKFIHASSGNKKVVITNFDKKRFYKNRFLWGRRIIENSVNRSVELLSFNGLSDIYYDQVLKMTLKL